MYIKLIVNINKDWKFSEIAKEVPQASNKDREQDKDQSNERVTESEQTEKSWTKWEKLILISFNHRKSRKWLIPREWWGRIIDPRVHLGYKGKGP